MPVGENLHDHPMIGLICSVLNGTTVTTKSLTLLEIFKYYWQGKGMHVYVNYKIVNTANSV